MNPESQFPQKYEAAQLFINKYFLSSKSAYYYDFWKIMWHWRLE